MVHVSGVDGCKYGWLRATQDLETNNISFDIFSRFEELIWATPRPAVIAVDMPIGLPDAGQRGCDIEARRILGKRHTTVFSAPIRPAITARSREQAATITQQRDGRRVGTQSWSLYPKILEVDTVLQNPRGLELPEIREVHPEVCFWNWTGGEPIPHNKKTLQGKRDRLDLIEPWLGEYRFGQLRKQWPKNQVADDDIIDAIAALRTAMRIVNRANATIPETPERDSTGLVMEMAY